MTGELTPRRDQLSSMDWLLLAGGAVVAYGLFGAVGPGLLGPEYLFYFALVWVSLTAAHLALRHWWRNSFALSFVAAVVLAAVAINRYRWGIQYGMHRWTFLTIMTVIGCVTFFLRASQMTPTRGDRSEASGSTWIGGCGSSSNCSAGSSSSCSAGSSSSSCSSGGGGCGGGGGGCGGCGGG